MSKHVSSFVNVSSVGNGENSNSLLGWLSELGRIDVFLMEKFGIGLLTDETIDYDTYDRKNT